MNKDEVCKLLDTIEDNLCKKYGNNCLECMCGVSTNMSESICAIQVVNSVVSEVLSDRFYKKEVKE